MNLLLSISAVLGIQLVNCQHMSAFGQDFCNKSFSYLDNDSSIELVTLHLRKIKNGCNIAMNQFLWDMFNSYQSINNCVALKFSFKYRFICNYWMKMYILTSKGKCPYFFKNICFREMIVC